MKDSEKQKLAAVEAYIEGCQGLIDPKRRGSIYLKAIWASVRIF
ncbi:hypothetical protein [Ensifer sp. Root278]|nr:hypothetical protein [Ensifer sp. Root278]